MNLRKTFPKSTVSLFIALIAVFFPSHAVEVSNLYQAEVVVEATSSGKQQAAKLAFKKVLVSLSGEKFVNSNKQIKTALAKSNNYLSQFRYSQKDGKTFLLASFEEAKVNKLLQDSNASIWGKHRPLITVWTIDEQGLERKIIDDSSLTVKQTIISSARERGLPVNFPLMDLTDTMQVSKSDIWGRFQDRLLNASSRYLAEAVLIIRISNSTLIEEPDITMCGQVCKQPLFVADWQLLQNGMVLQNKISADDKDKLLTTLIHNVAEQLHQQNSYVFSNDKKTYLDIEIANVTSMHDFVGVSEFLTNLTLVSEVKLINVAGEKMLFRLNILADENAIMQSLKLENSLVENVDPLAQMDVDKQLSFFWKG
ncbi:DUF2066 domain-containing protein [Thalassotalea sp. ND16A]|uniref:DUF2066 domain-containing protein n=1 Tax=Thalassotalea sp. ND16A TaxID=1535422 RepID=UPI00051A4A84|nr:DUF2066 domain-containing protein [Thalassotalea sp. ND16A]KGJ88725.1 hypothetical protein ND16A_2427 [Thalassotalea sp. ND16A]